MKLKLLIALSGLLLLTIMPVAAQNVPELFVTDCPFEIPDGEVEGDTMECLTFDVPESRTGASDAILNLLVIVLNPLGEEQTAPVIYFSGGPGGSASSEVEGFLDIDIRQYATIVMLEQRGTGYSIPTLDCPEMTDPDIITDTPEEDCYARLLKEGIDPGAYNSAENAADAADLIAAMDTEVNLYGISYGTRLALTIMANYPKNVRSVILDGVYPPNVQAYEQASLNAVRSFRLMFEQCKEDSECAATFPDLEEEFYRALDSLDREPLLVLDAEGVETEMLGGDLIQALFMNFYDTEGIHFAPAIIYAASHGDADTVGNLLYGMSDETAANVNDKVVWQAEPDGDSEGMFNSVECADEVLFNDVNKAEAAVQALKLDSLWEGYLLETLQVQYDTCKFWKVPQADPRVREATVSDIPTLIFNGEYDPITPPAWGELASKTLRNSYVYTIPASGHGVLDTAECPRQIAFEFLTDPEIEPEGDCVRDMPAPLWYVDYRP
jgi:pimeloyl-ACP methyl ester carboxylesterase